MTQTCELCKEWGIYCEDKPSLLNIPLFPPSGRTIHFQDGFRHLTADPIFRCYPLHHPDSRQAHADIMKARSALTAHGAKNITGRDPSIPMVKKETF